MIKPKLEKTLMGIFIDEEGTISWRLDPDMTEFQRYAVYGLMDLMKGILGDDLKEGFRPIEEDE